MGIAIRESRSKAALVGLRRTVEPQTMPVKTPCPLRVSAEGFRAVTFAQDKDSSVVHGMPGEAIKLGAATLVLSPDKIAAVLTSLANNGK